MNQSTNQPEGILLIDKPSGWTSFDVVAKIRRLTGVKKVGHAGTLDPLATGLLIILVGKKFTRMQDKFLKQDKSYSCTAIIGIETDSYDIDGKIIKQLDWQSYNKLSKADVEKVLPQFRGKIQQTVPAFSAIKRNGAKLVDLARTNQLDLTQLPTRQVEIDSLQLDEFDKNDEKKTIEIGLSVSCQSGTYIRSLVDDIGKALGLVATVKQLRRTRIGQIDISQAQLITDPLSFVEDL